MILIENEGELTFWAGEETLSLKDGFAYLDKIYPSEPIETKRIIDRLKQKYLFSREVY